MPRPDDTIVITSLRPSWALVFEAWSWLRLGLVGALILGLWRFQMSVPVMASWLIWQGLRPPTKPRERNHPARAGIWVRDGVLHSVWRGRKSVDLAYVTDAHLSGDAAPELIIQTEFGDRIRLRLGWFAGEPTAILGKIKAIADAEIGASRQRWGLPARAAL